MPLLLPRKKRGIKWRKRNESEDSNEYLKTATINATREGLQKSISGYLERREERTREEEEEEREEMETRGDDDEVE
jgi:hypothetical protein